jgi:hypothetical protein
MDTQTVPPDTLDELVLVENIFDGQAQLMTSGELEHAEDLGWSATDAPTELPAELDEQPAHPHAELAAQQVAGLRELADLIEAHAELAAGMRSSLKRISYFPVEFTQPAVRAELAAFVRATKARGARITKQADDTLHKVTATINDAVGVQVLAYRSEVCERVVIGTETVTKTVPDPEALAAVPTIEVTETVEHVEWRCTPLLAPATTCAA